MFEEEGREGPRAGGARGELAKGGRRNAIQNVPKYKNSRSLQRILIRITVRGKNAQQYT